MKISAEQLAFLLYEELDRDQWGDVDPYLFKHIVLRRDLDPEPDDNDADAAALRQVLTRVVDRLELE